MAPEKVLDSHPLAMIDMPTFELGDLTVVLNGTTSYFWFFRFLGVCPSARGVG